MIENGQKEPKKKNGTKMKNIVEFRYRIWNSDFNCVQLAINKTDEMNE